MEATTVHDAAEQGHGGESDSLSISFTPTVSELINASATLSRAGTFINGFGGYAATWTVIALVAGAPFFVLLPPLVFAIGSLTGYYCAPFIWYAVWRRRDLVLTPTTVTLDDDGVEARTASASARQAWTFYRRARDLGDSVALEAGPNLAVLLLKRNLDEPERAQLRRILDAHGLFRPPTGLERAKPFLATAIGAVIALLQLNLQLLP
jgi:hypothetical protein